MSEQLRCLDGQPDLLIPRMYFVFDETSQLFQFHVPNVDIASSQPLKTTPSGLQTMPRPKSMREGLASCELENAIGSICLSEQAGMTVADIAIGQLPGYDEVAPEIRGYSERRAAENKTRLPYLKARYELFKMVVHLSELQYEFGIPQTEYDMGYPEAPARFSLTHDYNHFAPVTVVTTSFEQALSQCCRSRNEANHLTDIARRFVQRHDPEASKFDTDYVRIAQYGIFSDGVDFGYGQRGMTIDDMAIDFAEL